MMLNIRQWLRMEVTSDKLFINLLLGLLIGITEVIFAISMGSLLFSGELNDYLPLSIGVALFTGMIMLVALSILGSVPIVMGTLQDSPNVIMVIIISGLVSSAKNVGVENKLEIVLVTIAITTLLTGGVLMLLGSFKLGGLVRFVPYPVIGGFLAGTGWLLAQGSFGVMADFPLTFSNLIALAESDRILLWLPGLILALSLFFGLKRFDSSLVMPAILIGAVLVFYLALFITGTSIEQAVDSGLLLGELPGEMAWQPLNFKSLQNVDWSVILGQSGNIATILIISVLGLLLSASAVELATEKDLDLNRELRVAGVANLLSGLGGGLVGYQSVMLSVLAHRLGGKGRIISLVAGAVCGVMLFVGVGLLTFFPRPILGGLLLYFGLDFLDNWVIKSWPKLSRLDYSVVILILVVIATTNFLMGVAVGLVATISLFVFSYSRIDVVRHSLSGTQMRSNVERLEQQKQTLKKLGEHIFILELQGFIFFGTANALLNQIKTRLSTQDQLHPRFIIFDFQRVSGLDSSAVFSFIKCRQIAEQLDIQMVLTDVPQDIYRQLTMGGLVDNSSKVQFFPDLDRGLEWCENRLLDLEVDSIIEQPLALPDRLVDAGFREDDIGHFMGYLEKVELEEGECLMRQGEKSDCLYFIESGKLSIYLELENDEQVRLQTLHTRLIVGEMGLYLGATRTASIVADEPSIVFGLPKVTLDRMTKKDPRLAVSLHEFIATILADRLADTTRLLSAVTK